MTRVALACAYEEAPSTRRLRSAAPDADVQIDVEPRCRRLRYLPRDGAAGPEVAKRVDGAGHREREAEQFEQSHRRYALPLLDSVSLQTVVVTTENPTRCGRTPSRDQETPAKNHFMPPKKSAANVALGAAARAMRSERGMPQEAFAGRAGIDRSYYGAIERGEFNVSLDTIMKIAGALEIPAAALLQRARL